jgi:hypothetical protein
VALCPGEYGQYLLVQGSWDRRMQSAFAAEPQTYRWPTPTPYGRGDTVRELAEAPATVGAMGFVMDDESVTPGAFPDPYTRGLSDFSCGHEDPDTSNQAVPGFEPQHISPALDVPRGLGAVVDP